LTSSPLVRERVSQEFAATFFRLRPQCVQKSGSDGERMPRLTKRIVESAEVREKDYFITDEELPGFSLRVLPSGRKNFTLQYRAGTKTRRFNLGSYGILTPEAARAKATGILAAVREGKDPAGERLAILQAPTLRDLAKRFMEDYCAHRVKPSTKDRYAQLLDTYILPKLGHRRLLDITRADIVDLHTGLAKKKSTANRMLAVVSLLFNLAETWGWYENRSNPARRIVKYKEQKRERFLTAEELRRLGETLVMAENARLISHHALAAFKLLILTGARCSEIQTCKWEYVDMDAALIRLPDSKTGAKFIHLGATAMQVLRGIERVEGNPYLICSAHVPSQHIFDLQNSWQQIRRWAKLDQVRIHDLRHTFASRAVAMGMTLPVIGRLLGHTQTQTTDRYAHLAVNPILEAADKVTHDIGGLLALPAPEAPDTAVPASPAPKSVSILEGKLRIVGSTEHIISLPVFLTSAETAKYLNVKTSLLDYWRWQKKGPSFAKVGNRVRYKLEDVQAFVQEGLASGTSIS